MTWIPANPKEAESADSVLRFISYMRHSKGKFAGQPFELLPWQQDIVRPLFGKLREDGTRQYNQAYIEVPRKNGKTQLAAAIALKCLLADGEPEGEVYCAASDKDQASLVFAAAAAMIRSNPQLAAMVKIIEHTKRIVVTKGRCAGSFLRAIPADAGGAHGFNASAVICDELHTWPNRELWDVLRTSQGARRQPLLVAITTAGYNRASLCWEIHEHAREVLEGTIQDDSFLPVLYGADDSDDWTDPATWYKANPCLGTTIEEGWIRQECQSAIQSPGYQNAFRRLYLNQWTSGETRWLPMHDWDTGDREIPNLTGRICYAGLDLASTTDLAAFVLVFPPKDPDSGDYYIIPRFFIPSEGIRERSRRDRVPYELWVQEGHVIATPGNVIDYSAIKREIDAMREQYNVMIVGFDPWNAIQMAQDLEYSGAIVAQVRQGFLTMSAPTKELLRLALDHRLVHGGHPVLRWNADSLMVEQDAAGNFKPSKSKSTQRIDGIVASIMALDLCMRNANIRSPYEDEDAEVMWI